MKSSAVIAAVLAAAAIFTVGCTAANEEDADSAEGAASTGSSAAGADCEPATLAEVEMRMAPLDSARLCTDVSKGSPDATFVKAKCLAYANPQLFTPEAGQIAAICLRDAQKGRAPTAIEAKSCGGRGLRSVCRSDDSNGWCKTVVANVTVKKGHEGDNAGGGLTQKCRWNAPGLAAGGRFAVDLCINDTKFTSFASCIDAIGAP